MRLCGPGLWGIAALWLYASATCFVASAGAVPPGAAVGSALPKAKWVKHRVIPGERLKEIGKRYGVSTRSLIRWNKLDPKRPRLRAGSRLRVHTRLVRPARERIRYKVRRGDSWGRIARRHGVRESHLRRRWNPRSRRLRPGDRIVIYVEGDAEQASSGGGTMQVSDTAFVSRAGSSVRPSLLLEGESAVQDFLGAEAAAVGMPIVPVSPVSQSVGWPSGGRIRHPLQLPDNPVLYTIRSPAHAYGASHTLYHLQMAIARWRARTAYGRELVIMDMSRKGGGRLRPHRSHRSGRDVDIRLPLASGIPDGTVPIHADQVDWDAAWDLVHALIETGEVTYIFLTRSRQVRLRAAAVRAGASDAYLAKHIQYPMREKLHTVRHSKGHTKHIHVRFKCAPNAQRCKE